MSKALGRGLSALIGDSTDTINKGYHAEKNNHAIYALPIHILHAGSLQPRKHFDQEDIKNLAESIKANGIIQPLIVRKSNDNSFEIIAGERRWRAAMLAELDHVPVIIKDIDNKTALQLAIIENIQRKDLNIIEEANGYKQLINDFCYTQEKLSEIVGKSRSHIANLMRILSLPNKIINMLQFGTITFGHARALIGIEEKKAIELANYIEKNSLNVRQTEKLIKKTSTQDLGQKELETEDNSQDNFTIIEKNKTNVCINYGNEIEQLFQKYFGAKILMNAKYIKIYHNNNSKLLESMLLAIKNIDVE